VNRTARKHCRARSGDEEVGDSVAGDVEVRSGVAAMKSREVAGLRVGLNPPRDPTDLSCEPLVSARPEARSLDSCSATVRNGQVSTLENNPEPAGFKRSLSCKQRPFVRLIGVYLDKFELLKRKCSRNQYVPVNRDRSFA
jgi:hypothetical protein